MTKWLTTLERHLRRDIAERTWAAFCLELRWIKLQDCDHKRGVDFVLDLFGRFPTFNQRSEAIRLIAHISYLLPVAFLEGILDSLGNSTRFTLRQAAGELLALIAFRDENHSWAETRLNGQLAAIENDPSHEALAVGIAFAAAQMWDEPHLREGISLVLCRLIPHATDRIARAIGTVFWAREDFAADGPTESLLAAFAANPNGLGGEIVTDLVEHLVALVPHKRILALNICKAILSTGRRESDLFEAGPNLVKIAMTLQRFQDTRSEGLSLLEAFLQLGLDDAFRVLHDIDIRPAPRTARVRQRRRRRRH